MSTHVYFGCILASNQRKVFNLHDLPLGFQALHPGPHVVASTPQNEADGPAWVGVEAQGLPAGPVPLASLSVRSFRYRDTVERWHAFCEFVRAATGLDLGEGELLLTYLDTDED